MAWQCDLDWQAIATFVTGFLAVGGAVVVGKRQTRILERQTEIQDLTLRSDLFDRRYKVFERVEQFLGEITATATDPSNGTQRDFAVAMGEARFLFDKKLNEGLHEIRAQWAQFHKVNVDSAYAFQTQGAYGEDNNQRHMDLCNWFDNRFRTLPDLFDELKLSGDLVRSTNGRQNIAGNCSPNGRS